jgi:hypothetical protein
MMLDTRIILSGLWIASMLNNLWGDVLRIMTGDLKFGEIDGVKISQGMWLGIAVLMVIPIIMVFLSLTLDQPVNRWANIIDGIVFLVINITSLPGSPSHKFLIIVGIGLNALSVWYAWKWVV